MGIAAYHKEPTTARPEWHREATFGPATPDILQAPH
jgi:hypothetical protein